MDPEQRLRTLLEESRQLDDLPALETLEEAIRLADELGRLNLQYELRREFVHSAYNAGQADRMLVALGWCLGVHETRPGEFDEYEILAECQLALQYVASFVSITRQQIEELLDETRRRYQKCNASSRSLLLNLCFNAFWMGELEAARGYLAEMLEAPKDDLFHPDWEMILEADYCRHCGDDERMLGLPSLRMNTPYQVAQKYVISYALAPLLRKGDVERADYLLKTVPLIRDARTIDPGSDQLVYLFASGRLDEAAKLLEDLGREALQMPADQDRFQYLAAAAYGLDRLSREGIRSARMRLPAEFPGRDATDDTSQLAAAARQAAEQIAQAFNQRNGTLHYSTLLERLDGLQEFEAPRR